MKPIRTKKKSLLMRICIFAFAGYMVVSLVTLQMEISSKYSELAALEQQVKDQEAANKETERLIGFGSDEDYLSRIARDKLDMGLADERVFRDATGS